MNADETLVDAIGSSTGGLTDEERIVEGGFPDGPLTKDKDPFSKWLLRQVKRQDRIGAFAKVAQNDPGWPGGSDQQVLRNYLLGMGTRLFVVTTLDLAFKEYGEIELERQKKAKARAKGKSQRTARKTNRAPARSTRKKK